MTRRADHDIDDQFLRRWSPRAMNGQPMAREALMRLFEAARWAPSSGNAQPWRFVYALAGTDAFQAFFDLLVEGNKPWCARAGALVIVASHTHSDSGRPQRTHSFDTGAAWMSLALQASRMGLVVHGMEGFDYDRAPAVAGLPPGTVPECMIAIGHPGAIEDLPEKYRAREAPNDRNPVSSFAFEGRMEAPSPAGTT